MIIFYNKKTREIIGTIDGRVHYETHKNVSISAHNHEEEDIGKVIIGWIEDEEGNRTEHNMHLWDHLLDFENPHHPRTAIKEKTMLLDDKIIGFE